MPPVNDEITIKLHTDPEGHIWYAAGVGPAHNSGYTVNEFLASKMLVADVPLHIRVIGTANHASLLAELYTRISRGDLKLLEVAGPNICASLAELADPELTLHRMRSSTLPPACGGWRTFTVRDYMTHLMISRMQQSGDAFDMHVAVAYHAHPARFALSFIPTISEQHAARVLKEIVDPRWYVDRRAPERQGKLELYMGLTPDVQKAVSDDSKLICGARALRCATVLEAWKTAHPGAIDLQNPGNFLYRIYKTAGCGTKGDLRASQAFLRYLRFNWLDALDVRKGAKDGLFAPDMFFKTPTERAAYELHMSS